jgi:hypothetical protein
MKKAYITIACLLCFFRVANAELDKSGEFSFTPPAGWKTHNTFSKHTSFTKDGYSILIGEERGESPLTEVKRHYEERSKNFKNYKLISSNIVKLKNGKEAIKVIREWEMRNIHIRNVSYVVTLKTGNRISIVCTVPREVGDSYDRIFDRFVNSIK